MVVVAMIPMRIRFVAGGMDDARVFVDRHSAMSMGVVVMLHRVAARIARMRAEDSDQAREDGADQRQKNDCLNHLAR